MSKTCLQIIQSVAGEMQLAVPAAAWSSSDQQIIQLRELLNEAGDDLRKWPDKNWNKLMIETSFSTLAANLQPAIPSDFDRMIPMTMWNRTMNRQVWGPMDEQQWQQELAGPTFTSPYYAYRLRGGNLYLTPVPAAGNSVFYEYISNFWVYSSSATPNASAFSADGDTCVFPDRLIESGLRWRFLRANGQDYAQERDDWIALLMVEIARDQSAQRLSTTERYPWNRRTPFIPLGSWNA